MKRFLGILISVIALLGGPTSTLGQSGEQAQQTLPPRALDQGGDSFMSILSGEDLTTDESLTIILSDDSRTMTLSGNPTMGDWFDQGVKTTDLPTFPGVNGATDFEFKIGDTVEFGLQNNYLNFNNGSPFNSFDWADAGKFVIRTGGTDTLVVGYQGEVGSVRAQGKMYAFDFVSLAGIGEVPLTVTSTTLVDNLNADMVDDKHVGTSGSTLGLLDGTNTWSGDQTLGTTTRHYYRDANQSIWSSAASILDFDAGVVQHFRINNGVEMKLYANELRFINGSDYTGLFWNTNGELIVKTKNGILYLERARFTAQGLEIPSNHRTQYRDSAIYTNSDDDGHLDLHADTSIDLNSGVLVPTANGIDYTPGSDTDVDLITVNVTGTPKVWWDEATDSFETNKKLTLVDPTAAQHAATKNYHDLNDARVYSAGVRSSGAANAYMSGVANILGTATRGYGMPSDGSVIRMTMVITITAFVSPGTLYIRARMNGGNVMTVSKAVTGAGTFVVTATASRGANTFSAGDILAFYHEMLLGANFKSAYPTVDADVVFN